LVASRTTSVTRHARPSAVTMRSPSPYSPV
jgi:hypothetical protein